MWRVRCDLLYLMMIFWNSMYAACTFVIVLNKEHFADICISHILVTIYYSTLLKTQEHKFKAEDVILGD